MCIKSVLAILYLLEIMNDFIGIQTRGITVISLFNSRTSSVFQIEEYSAGKSYVLLTYWIVSEEFIFLN